MAKPGAEDWDGRRSARGQLHDEMLGASALAFVHVNELLVLFLAGLAVAVGTRSSTGALLAKFRSG
jgi:hypothetical protein